MILQGTGGRGGVDKQCVCVVCVVSDWYSEPHVCVVAAANAVASREGSEQHKHCQTLVLWKGSSDSTAWTLYILRHTLHFKTHRRGPDVSRRVLCVLLFTTPPENTLKSATCLNSLRNPSVCFLSRLFPSTADLYN